ncbi:MAG: hypothetical protein OEX02_07720 [Cyclobacteriaceae bacterium]|nr:hypothetical protein [Cyclobacteriaceae bacterium]
MMEGIAIVVGLFYFLGGVVAVALLIYFVMKRLEDKKKERFEKREN